MEKLKILLADASVTTRKIIADAVEKTSLGIVEHTAPNNMIALEWLGQCEMDVVLYGVSMMEHGSPDSLIKMKAVQPGAEVIMISDGDPGAAEMTIKALENGAFDFILKPEEQDTGRISEKVADQLNVLFAQIKVRKLSMVDPQKRAIDNEDQQKHELQNVEKTMQPRKAPFEKPELVVIASSTGGPAALETVFRKLPGNFPVPILVVQHMPAEFTSVFARNLDKVSELEVFEAGNGSAVKNGQAVIAAGGSHMTVIGCKGKDISVALDKSPYVNGVRPSADILFSSAAKVFEGRNVLAVILTGMGNDGMQGVSELKKRCSCYCITQSESSSVVYGMPRCVFESGLSDETADITDVAGRICRLAI